MPDTSPGENEDVVRYLSYAASVFLFAILSLVVWLFSSGVLNSSHADAFSAMAFSLLLGSMVFSYLFLRGLTLKRIIGALGLGRNRINRDTVKAGLALLLGSYVIIMLIGLYSQLTGIELPTNVDKVLAGLPQYFLVFTFLIGPINEELFFRGLIMRGLAQRTNAAIGIIGSAILFAAAHASYSSISEFAAAFGFGALSAYVYNKTGTLYPSIFAHMAINFVTISTLGV